MICKVQFFILKRSRQVWSSKHAYLIKNQVSTSFVRGQESQAQAFVKELEERQFAVSTRKWIEPMSLKYFCKEQTEKGVSIPPDLFGLHIGQKATITKPKE